MNINWSIAVAMLNTKPNNLEYLTQVLFIQKQREIRQSEVKLKAFSINLLYITCCLKKIFNDDFERPPNGL